MTYIVCVDDRMGMTFGGRRLSRDRVMLARMKDAVAHARLYTLPYSEPLFAEREVRITTDAAWRDEEAALFLETVDPTPYLRRGDRLLVYHFGRHYPSDMSLGLDLRTQRLLSTTPFVGSSHPEMLEEVYEIC